MARERGGDFMLVVIGLLLVVQATCLSYGLRRMHETTDAVRTELTRVACATR